MEVEKVERLDHLGVIAGIIDDLGIVEVLDDIGGNYEGEKIPLGQTVKGLILNGLGYSKRPLSLVPQFFSQLPIESLIGEGVEALDFNRHKTGRVLDRLHSHNCSVLFSQIAEKVARQYSISSKFGHLDTTTFSVTGEGYEDSEKCQVEVTHGHSKDHRSDLRQVVHEILVSGDGGIPLVAKSWSGNESDSKIFQKRATALAEKLKESENFSILVGDSKLYSASNAETLKLLKFVTRIPNSIKEVPSLIEKAHQDTEQKWQSAVKRQYKTYDVEHYDIKQRWLVVQSSESKERAKKTVLRRVEKEYEAIKKALFHLQAQRFQCTHDAQTAVKQIAKKWKYHQVAGTSIEEHARYKLIMTIALLVYSIGERCLRAAIAERNETVPNQIEQPTSTPTLRWTFQCLFGISLLHVRENDSRRIEVIGLDNLKRKFISFFCPRVRAYYQIE